MLMNIARRVQSNVSNLKALPLMAAVMTIAIAAGAIAPSFAQSSTPTAPTEKRHQKGEWGKKLNLTEAQKAQLKSIRESSKAQLDNVLTQAQKDQLAAAKKGDRQARRQGWKSLNLTADQKASLKRIRQESKQQVEAVLTPEQRQMMKEMRANHKSNRGQKPAV